MGTLAPFITMVGCCVEGADEEAASLYEVRHSVCRAEHCYGKGWGRTAFLLASSLTWDRDDKELCVQSCSRGQEDLCFHVIK